MIPRYQRITFWVLVGLSALMAVWLFVGRQRSRDRISSLAENTPIDAPYTSSEPITLDLANDADGSMTATEHSLALPTETTARARALIDHLITEYALAGSAHPLPPGLAVDDVFLVPLPVRGYTVDPNNPSNADGSVNTIPVDAAPGALQPHSPGGELAVINLKSTFVNAHPSGVEVEMLTINSILGTLHANLPQIEQVRFLVDGQPRETLAGHIDLLRTYPVTDTTTAR
jgi:hypothetical protein